MMNLYEKVAVSCCYLATLGRSIGKDKRLFLFICWLSALNVSGQEINIMGNGLSISSGTTSLSTTNGTNFGTAYINNATWNSVRSYTIENTGSANLNVTAINISGTDASDFSVSGIILPIAVAAGTSTTFTITFLPRSVYVNPSATPVRLDRTATLTITNNDADEGSYNFGIGGTAGGEASVTLTTYKLANGTKSDTHGFETGDVIATYSPTSEGNITNTVSTDKDGSGNSKGTRQGPQGTGFTLTVTPLGVLPGQTWYLYYDDNTVTGYPRRNTAGGAGSGTTLITGIGSAAVTVTDVGLDGSTTDYLFYVDRGPAFSNTAPTISAVSDTTFGRSFSNATIDQDVNLADVDNDIRNNGVGNYTGSILTVQRNGGANTSDAFDLDVTGKTFSISGSNLIKNTKVFGTYSTTGNQIVLNFSGTEVIASSSLVDEVARSIVYTTALSGNQTLSFDYIFNDGLVATTAVKNLSLDNTEPMVTGGGGSTTSPSSLSYVENQTNVLQFTSNEIVNWSKTGGSDQALFNINSATGHLTFITAPDFENPSDADADNVYQIQVTATDRAGNTTTHILNITITNTTSEPTWTWNGAISTDWNTASNWTPASVPEGGATIVVPAGTPQMPILDRARNVHDISVATGVIVLLSNYTLTVTGTISNDGTIDALVTGKILLSGAASQTITGNGTIANMEVSNPAGVSIPSGSGNQQTITDVLTISAGILNTSNKLTLRSDANGTAMVAPIAPSASISGDVIVERYLEKTLGGLRNGRAWRLVSIPVKGTGLLRDYFMGGADGTDLTINSNVTAQTPNSGTPVIGHAYATANAANIAGYDWIGVPYQVSSLRYFQSSLLGGTFASSQVPDLSTTYTNAAQGYMIFARGDRTTSFHGNSNASSTTFRAIGTLNQGTVQVPVAPKTTASITLVGNPYMSVLDLGAVYNANSSVIKSVFYLWDSRKAGARNQGGYRTLSYNAGTASWEITGGDSNGQLVESHTAFFVVPQDANTSTQQISISESHKSVTPVTVQLHGISESKYGSLFVNLESGDSTAGNKIVEGVIARFGDLYREEADDESDIPTINNILLTPLWFSTSAKKMSVEGRQWPKTETILTMGIGDLQGGKYQYRFQPRGMVREGLTAWLQDLKIGTEHELPLDRESVQTFEVTADRLIDTARFRIKLKYTNNRAGMSLEQIDDNTGFNVFPNPSGSGIVRLAFSNQKTGSYQVMITDMGGRSLINQEIDHLTASGVYDLKQCHLLSAGQYLIRILGPSGQYKIVKMQRD